MSEVLATDWKNPSSAPQDRAGERTGFAADPDAFSRTARAQAEDDAMKLGHVGGMDR